MTTVTLDKTKLLGFRIGEAAPSRTGIKLGNVKEGRIEPRSED